MLNINQWRLIKESIAGSTNLGLARPNVIGGPVGSRLHQEDFDDEDEDTLDDEDEEYDGEQIEDEDDAFGDDVGPEQDFPPDDAQAVDGLPTPDEEMLGNDEFGGDFGGDEAGAPAGDDFLNDIDPALAGLGGEDEMGFGPEAGAEGGAELPCPDCNPDGVEQVGDEMCQTCAGQGFVPGDDLATGDDFSPDDLGGIGGEGGFGGDLEDDLSGGLGDDLGDDFGDEAIGDDLGGEGDFGDEEVGDDFGGEEDFGGDDSGSSFGDEEEEDNEKFMRRYMCKDGKKHHHCNHESSDPFLSSLAKQMRGTHNQKNKSGMSEDALLKDLDPSYNEPQAGQPGFAPQRRLGGIGGGYTKDDFKDMPVLGESRRYMTLTEYATKKRKTQKRRRK